MTTTNRPRRPGYALMLVMLEMALIAALWGIAYRQSTATMLFLTKLSRPGPAASGSNDGYKPMARALGLLETGDPPDGGSGVYACNATVYTASGPAYFIISYLKGTPDDTWTVTSTRQYPDAADRATWDNMPQTFGY